MAALSAAFGRAYDVVQQTIESLEIPISSFEIDGIFLRLDYLTRTLVNLDSSSSPTDEIVGLLGETMSYLRGIDTESSASAIEFAPKTFSGHCGRPSFEIKRSSYLILSTRASKFPSLPSCSGYRHERLKEEWQNTACPFQVQ